MKKKLIPTVLDTIFVFTATAAASFILLRYYLKSLWLPVIFSLIFGVLLAVIFNLISARKNITYCLKAKEAEHMENVLNTLCLMTDSELNDFFCTLFDKAEIPYSIENGIIVLTETNTELRYYFTFSDTYDGKIIEFYKQAQKSRNILVCGKDFTPKATGLTDRFADRIKLLDGANLYLTMKRFEIFPEIKELPSPEKHKINLPRELLSKKRARQYFLYGLTLEFFSFFVFYPIYYIAFGTALIVLSIVCFFFGINEQPQMNNPFR